MKKAGRFCLRCMGKFEEYVSMTMMSVTLIVTVVNVFARYVLRNSLPWSQEISGIAWTWAVMLGISWAYRSNLHMGIDLLVQKVGPRAKRAGRDNRPRRRRARRSRCRSPPPRRSATGRPARVATPRAHCGRDSAGESGPAPRPTRRTSPDARESRTLRGAARARRTRA